MNGSDPGFSRRTDSAPLSRQGSSNAASISSQGDNRSGDVDSRRVRTAPRRTKDRILDAARKQLVSDGLESITIHGVAREVGITHPAVLHHFGNRGNLLEEVVRSILQEFVSEFIEIFTSSDEQLAVEELTPKAFRILTASHLGRAYAAVAMSGYGESMGSRRLLRSLAHTVHDGLRTTGRLRSGVEVQDVAMTLLLVTSSAIGFATSGGPLLRSMGMDVEEQRVPGVPIVFEDWLSGLVGGVLSAEGASEGLGEADVAAEA